MPFNEDGSRKTVLYKKSSGFKMKGFSGFGNSPLTDKDPHTGKNPPHVGHRVDKSEGFGSKGTTEKIVEKVKDISEKVSDAIKTKATEIYEDPIGSYVKSRVGVAKKALKFGKELLGIKTKPTWKKTTEEEREKIEKKIHGKVRKG